MSIEKFFEWIPGGYPYQTLVSFEIWQAKQDGRDPSAVYRLEQKYKSCGKITPSFFLPEYEGDESTLLQIYKELLELPVDASFLFNEPDDLKTIRKLRPKIKQRTFSVPVSEDWLFDRLYGAWLGRCAGCTLGGPAEGLRPWTRKRLKEYLTAISVSEWPVTDYLPGKSPSDIKLIKPEATREQLSFVPADDDLQYTAINQMVLLNADPPTSFKSLDIVNTWMRKLSYYAMAGGTPMLSYRNFVIRYGFRAGGILSDEEIDWHWIATHSNPFREDIDAAIRADSFGYAAPGMPELAAELAYRDARISNVKNGIYCEMFYAAMIAAAFALDDPLAVVEAGLAEIPSTSRLYSSVKKVIDICRKYDFHKDRIEEVHNAIYETFGDDHCGTPNNMALIVSALLLGVNDFEKVITFCVMGGWDSDSTTATAGSIAGAMLGAKRLPEKWIRPLNDTFYSEVIGYHPIAISECAKRSVNIAKRVGQERV